MRVTKYQRECLVNICTFFSVLSSFHPYFLCYFLPVSLCVVIIVLICAIEIADLCECSCGSICVGSAATAAVAVQSNAAASADEVAATAAVWHLSAATEFCHQDIHHAAANGTACAASLSMDKNVLQQRIRALKLCSFRLQQ